MLYTGHTDNLESCVAKHESGEGGEFTRKYAPVKLVWSQQFPSQQDAIETENRIKSWSRAEKLALITGDRDAISRLSKPSQGGTYQNTTHPGSNSEQRSVDTRRISGCAMDRNVIEILKAEAARCAPHETCGILTGTANRITAAIPAANVHPAPRTHFEIDPAALIAAHKRARAGGPDVIGYYHSHPNGPARPSATDRASAAGDGRIWAIIGAARDVALWRDDKNGFTPLSYTPTNA